MDRLVAKPFAYETEALEGMTIQHLQLVTIKTQHTGHTMLNMPADVEHFKTLTYSYDEERATQGSRMSQPTLRGDNSPLVMSVGKEAAIKESDRLLMEIVRELEGVQYYADPSGKFVADKIDMLRKAISNLEYTELSAFVSKHMEEGQEWSPVRLVKFQNFIIIYGLNFRF